MDHIELAARPPCAVIIGGIRGGVIGRGEWCREQMRRGREALERCVARALERGVTLLLEPINRFETDIVNTFKEGLRLMSDIGCENLKLLADTFHMNIEEADMEKAILIAGSRLAYVHFSDSNRLAPGWGRIDFKAILGALRRAGYAGPIGIEVLPKPDDASAAVQALA